MDRIGLLLDYASQGNVAGVEMLLDEGLHVDSFDYDRRTALHLAASEGRFEVVKLLLERNAHVNPVDRWRKTPLADARRYLNAKTGTKGGLYTKVCDLLMRHDGSTSSPFEIDLDEQQLKDAQIICKNEYGENKLASWRGTKVRAMIIHRRQQPPGSRKLSADSTLIKELSLLQRLRHPNIVQFLGAVTNFHNKAKPVVVVTEHLSNGNLYQLLMGKKGRRFQPKAAVNFALDIARGMNYLHQHRPLPIVHRELNPMNLYPDAAGRLKVAGLGLTTLMKCIYGYEGSDEKGQNQICMYARPECSDKMAKYKAPELENSPKTCHADKSVDVYSFGMILYEMFQGPSLASRRAHGVLAPYRPSGTDAFPLRMTLAPTSKLGELLKRCLARNAEERPSFKDLISALEHTQHFLRRKPWWVPRPMVYMGSTLVSTLSTHWYNCILNTKKAFNNSIVSVDESIRGGAGGRSRRGANVITNCHTIEEEAQEEDKEKRSCDCQLT